MDPKYEKIIYNLCNYIILQYVYKFGENLNVMLHYLIDSKNKVQSKMIKRHSLYEHTVVPSEK